MKSTIDNNYTRELKNAIQESYEELIKEYYKNYRKYSLNESIRISPEKKLRFHRDIKI